MYRLPPGVIAVAQVQHPGVFYVDLVDRYMFIRWFPSMVVSYLLVGDPGTLEFLVSFETFPEADFNSPQRGCSVASAIAPTARRFSVKFGSRL